MWPSLADAAHGVRLRARARVYAQNNAADQTAMTTARASVGVVCCCFCARARVASFCWPRASPLPPTTTRTRAAAAADGARARANVDGVVWPLESLVRLAGRRAPVCLTSEASAAAPHRRQKHLSYWRAQPIRPRREKLHERLCCNLERPQMEQLASTFCPRTRARALWACCAARRVD